MLKWYINTAIAPSKGFKCIAPNCTTGYATCKQKLSLFSVPKDENIVKEWQKTIPRDNFEVKSGQVVCEKHFMNEDIIRVKEVKGPNSSIMASVWTNLIIVKYL